jgi:large subunit ribosomal protein L20
MCYAYRDRKVNKRNSVHYGFNVSTLELEGMSYSQFMGKVKKHNIELNRKVLQI